MAKSVYNRYYRMTAKRRAALRKAQLASARKRRRKKKIAISTASVVAVTAASAGGYGYGKRQRRKNASNVVSSTMSATSQAVHPIFDMQPKSSSTVIDVSRFTIENQIVDEDSKVDFSILGKSKFQPRKSKIRKTRGKLNVHIKRRRIMTASPDGELLTARDRRNLAKRMSYKGSKRRQAYIAARDRPDPPNWLRKK